MIRILYLLVKPDSMTHEQFEKECVVHFDMSRGMPGLHKYEVRLVDRNPTDTHVPYLDVGRIDAIGECWFSSEADYQVYMDSDIRKAWFEHGKYFIGKLKPFVTKDVV
ncbi:4-methylmuconolactone methylisomerase [Pseudomonas sp. NPDC090208]|uniref:4-methylmuconolactone methylisomerase n=1 Tax=Pseudomonas sp. NPDC090208 TaxID=3364478 RepID=UPI0037FEE09D